MSRSHKETMARSRYRSMAFFAFFMVAISILGLAWINEAQALRLSMKRIIFEGPKRSDIITIMNNTDKEQIYRLGLRRYRMDEEKSLVRVKDDDPIGDAMRWADDMIRYAPRRVTVPPGGSQQIRILLRRPRGLEEAEYRSHLWIVTEARPDEFSPDQKGQTGARSFKINMQPALTLPVFVRHGDLQATAKITDAKIAKTEDGMSVAFTLHREGNRSLYGDLKVVCTGNGEYLANQIRGVAVYPEINKRIFEYEFLVPADKIAGCRNARIEYVADKHDVLYGGEVMASVKVSG